MKDCSHIFRDPYLYVKAISYLSRFGVPKPLLRTLNGPVLFRAEDEVRGAQSLSNTLTLGGLEVELVRICFTEVDSNWVAG